MPTALLIIDVQQHFINQFTSHVPKRIATFVKSHHTQFDKIIFFKFLNQEGSNWMKETGWKEMILETEIQLADDILEVEKFGTTFIKLASFSIFRVKKLVELLKLHKISKLFRGLPR